MLTSYSLLKTKIVHINYLLIGSKSEKWVRSGFYDPQTKVTRVFDINSIAGVFTAEAYAILQALLILVL